MERLIGALRAVNRAVALLCGAALLATAGFVLVEIALRAVGARGLGGSDEVAGYVMAGVAAWGLAYALTEGAHVRIDMAVRPLRPAVRDAVDVAALASIAAVAIAVAARGWQVVATSLDRGSRANTPLETPLWWPQIVWWAGWGWFAACSALLALAAGVLALRRRSQAVRALAGGEDAPS